MDLLAFAKDVAERIETQSTRQGTSCRFCHRYPWQHHPPAPHEWSAGFLDRAIGAESLHVRANWTSNGRSLSPCAARAGTLPSDGAVGGTILFYGRRRATRERRPKGRGRRRERRQRG